MIKTCLKCMISPKESEIITYCQGAYRAANSFLSFKKTWISNMLRST